MNEININVKFFAWLENFKFDNKLNMVNRTTKTWLKHDNNKVVHEEYHPFESIKVIQRGTQVTTSPIKEPSMSDDVGNWADKVAQPTEVVKATLKLRAY
jgi:hypothetical protein